MHTGVSTSLGFSDVCALSRLQTKSSPWTGLSACVCLLQWPVGNFQIALNQRQSLGGKTQISHYSKVLEHSTLSIHSTQQSLERLELMNIYIHYPLHVRHWGRSVMECNDLKNLHLYTTLRFAKHFACYVKVNYQVKNLTWNEFSE